MNFETDLGLSRNAEAFSLNAPKPAFEEQRFSALLNGRRLNFALKRAMDVVISLSALVILFPMLLFVAALVKTTSRGPALFSQIRWGMNGKKIRIYKFRSMYSNQCDSSGVLQTVLNDARVTPVGKILRRTNIDELPQLFNVLIGDMSLVGPRCHAIGMKAAGIPYEELVPWYHDRHSVRPGLTGLAQARGLRGPTDIASVSRLRIAYDLHYINTFSIWLDIKIIWWTLRSELAGGKGF